jgi:hypothetical protein
LVDLGGMNPSRRALIVATGASLMPLRSSLAAGLVATPQQTEGPFYPTSFPADMDNDLVQVRGSPMPRASTIIHASPVASGAIRPSRATAACW